MSRKRRKLQGHFSHSRSGSSPLLSLPDEVLDYVLSYAIIVPWHPKNAIYPQRALKDLFIPTIHVNQRLRQHTSDLISRNTLWIHVECRQRELHERFAPLQRALPKLLPWHRSLLAENSPGVTFLLGKPTFKRETRAFNASNNSLVFPYNAHSFAQLCRIMPDVWQTTVLYGSMPSSLQSVVDGEIAPILSILAIRLPITIVSTTGQRSFSRSTNFSDDYSFEESIAREIDAVVQHMKVLDQAGRPLEACILALHHGTAILHQCFSISEMVVFEHWAPSLTADDYATQPGNLERMRILRTLHYIEKRAWDAYISGCNAYGFDFHVRFLGDRDSTNVPGERWVDGPSGIDWYGLPDHEMAEYYYTQASLSYVNLAWFKERIDGVQDAISISDMSESDLRYKALKDAYVAWRFNKRNIKHATLFKNLAEESESLCKTLLEDVQRSRNRDPTDFGSGYGPVWYTDVDDHLRAFGGLHEMMWEWGPGSEYLLKYLWRAQQIAKRAPVTYDERREHELSELDYHGDDDEQSILRDMLGQTSTNRLRFDRFGITQQDFDEYEHRVKLGNMWENWKG